MAYIYVITNKVNGKQYVGRTRYLDPVKRFQEHLRESRKERNENRPLHRAINKYGEEGFEFKVLEEVSEEASCQREIFWIDKLNTYGSSGYNATKGGDGKTFLNYEKIIDDYKELNSLTKVAILNGCHSDSVGDILRAANIPIEQYPFKKKIRAVFANETLIFDSIVEGAAWVLDAGLSKTNQLESIRKSIGRAVNGKRKTYLNAVWEEI